MIGPNQQVLEPDEWLRSVLHANGRRNWYNVSDPTLDRLLEEQAGILHPEERLEAVHAAQRDALRNVVAGAERASARMDDPRSRLCELRSATVRRAAGLVSSFDGIVEATTDVAVDDEHDPEGHTIAWERQQVAALLDETTTVLAEIEAAEHRLDDGSYGTCTSCGLEIAAERLDALPATPTCVDCARHG